MNNLRITLVQTALHWNDPEANRRMLDEKLAPLAGVTDLIVLPEMFTTGFTMEPERYAEAANGRSVDWLRRKARDLRACVVGSVATLDGGKHFNRLTWARPDGSCASYDKRHLFRMGREHEHYAAGAHRIVVELNGWRICPLVCYDLRFPVWSRQGRHPGQEYDVLLYVANWPERRRYAWSTLLKARAIENLCYCVGVNRIGADGAGVTHTGDSMAFDFLGQPMLTESTDAFVQIVSLDAAALTEIRERFPAHLDADDFRLNT
jgi:predicted amidohydrolase